MESDLVLESHADICESGTQDVYMCHELILYDEAREWIGIEMAVNTLSTLSLILSRFKDNG